AIGTRDITKSLAADSGDSAPSHARDIQSEKTRYRARKALAKTARPDVLMIASREPPNELAHFTSVPSIAFHAGVARNPSNVTVESMRETKTSIEVDTPCADTSPEAYGRSSSLRLRGAASEGPGISGGSSISMGANLASVRKATANGSAYASHASRP